jgi:ribA/ribD-fused uncharacterized protein
MFGTGEGWRKYYCSLFTTYNNNWFEIALMATKFNDNIAIAELIKYKPIIDDLLVACDEVNASPSCKLTLTDPTLHEDIFSSYDKKSNIYPFYGGVFSNWYKCNIQDEDIKYISSEQYIMHHKALLFNDSKVAKQIMESSDNRTIKAFGRKVSNFNQKIWDENKERIAITGLLLKFSQNSALKEKLLDTKNDYLVEASKTDKIWGVGIALSDPDIYYKSKWNGTNLLGKCLMKVRCMINHQKI